MRRGKPLFEAYTEAYHSGGEPPPPTDWKELVRTPPPDAF